MRYFLVRDQNSYGPYDVAEIEAYLKAGNLIPADRLQSEDRSVQTTVAGVLSFRATPSSAPPAPPPGPATADANGGGAPGTAGSASAGGFQPTGGYSPVVNPQPQVPNNLVFAILVTLFCCLPFGIVAIVYAAQVNTKLAVGDIQGAMQASKQARTWSIVGLCGGFVVVVLSFMLGILGSLSNS